MELPMKKLEFKYRGKSYSGTIAIPNNLEQASLIMTEDEIYSCFVRGYIEEQKKKIRLKRVKKYMKVKLDELSDEQKEALKALGLLWERLAQKTKVEDSF